MTRGSRSGPGGRGTPLASRLSANRTAPSPAYAMASATGPHGPVPRSGRRPGDLGTRGLRQPSGLLGGEP